MLFDVSNFGAIADDGIDDRAAIQAAIDAAHDAGGGTVQIGAGTYDLTGGAKASEGSLVTKSNVHIVGAGMGNTILRIMDNWDQSITGIIRTKASEETHDYSVSDLTLDGNRANNTTGKIDGWYNGFKPGEDGADYNVTLSRVEIKNSSGYGFDPHEQTINLRIEDSVSHHNGLDGFVADYLIDSVYINNLAYDNDRHGFNVTTTTNNFLLKDNIAHSNGSTGLTVQRGGELIPSPSQIHIEGGAYYQNATIGIDIKLSSHVTVEGATFYENQREGLRITGSDYNLITGNTFYENSQQDSNDFAPILVTRHNDTNGASGMFQTSSHNVITGNIITGSPVTNDVAIKETTAFVEHTHISGNIITGYAQDVKLVSASSTYEVMPAPSHAATPEADVVVNTDGVYTTISTAGGNDSIYGHQGDDSIDSGSGDDLVSTSDGNDTVHGRSGDDTIFGGRGEDSIKSSGGDDSVEGNADDDYINLGSGNDYGSGGTGDDYLQGYVGNDTLEGGLGHDRLRGGADNDEINGGRGDDTLEGDAGNDTLDGGRDKDIINGDEGNDLLFGAEGDDTLSGGTGSDTLTGARGADLLSGGADADIFAWTKLSDSTKAGGNKDIITDFVQGEDLLDVSGIGMNALTSNNQTLEGEVRVSYYNDNTYVKHDGDTRFEFVLQGEFVLTESDFIFA